MRGIDPTIALSPLADPVVNAVFANEEVAGLAAESLIGAVMETDEEAATIDKIISVTPQRSRIDPMYRGCRVDIETVTQSNDRIIFEIQINPDITIMQRDLFTASHIFTRASMIGDSHREMAQRLPVVIFINILGYNIREDNPDIVQPFKVMYAKEPLRTAIPNFSGYNVQLPRLHEMPKDFTSGLYCWCYLLLTAHDKKITVKEVLDMTPELQQYAYSDKGFQQFCTQYQFVSGNPEVREEYFLWYKDWLREQGIIITAEKKGEEKASKEWQPIVAAKDKELAAKDEMIATKDEVIATKDEEIAARDAEIAELRRRLGE